ncbi:ABC transporter substrate-binding protein [Lachnospiraceae bacterium LCP25S3_G4]
MKRRKWCIFLCVVMVGAMIIGCTIQLDNLDNTNPKKKENKIKLETSKITVMTSEEGAPSVELLTEFTDETGIEVTIKKVEREDIRDKVTIAASGGTSGADVIEVDWSWIGMFSRANWLEPLIITKVDKADFPILEYFTIGNQTLAIPYDNNFQIAYYNVEQFRQAGIETIPTTWEEVREDLIRIKDANVVEYPLAMDMDNEELTTTSMICMALSRSGAVFNGDGSINTASLADALTFSNQLINVDLLVDPIAKTSSGADAYQKLRSGEASFMIGPVSCKNPADSEPETQAVGQIVPILLPGRSGTSRYTIGLPKGIGVTTFSKNKAAATQYVKWYTSADIQNRLFEENHTIPTRTSVLAELVGNGAIANAGAMIEESKRVISPFPKGVPDYYFKLSHAIYYNVNRMVLGEVTSEDACKRINEKILALVAEQRNN